MFGSDADSDLVAAAFWLKEQPGLFLVAPDGHMAYKRTRVTESEQARLAIIETMSKPSVSLH